MTKEEAWNRIDAIIEKHEVDDVYVTINNHKDYDALRFARKLLEQEPCDELDFVQPHKKVSVNLQVYKMREATQEEREGVEQYIDSIAESCDIAISRQAAVEAFQMFREYESNRSNKGWVNRIETVLNQLPPVNTQAKVGHWIFVDKAHEHAHCSECDYGNVDLLDGRPHNYCPNCGCRMVEPQESEVSEHFADIGKTSVINKTQDCDTCKHHDKSWDELPCDGCCGAHSGYESQGRSEE